MGHNIFVKTRDIAKKFLRKDTNFVYEIAQEYHVVFREDGTYYYENDNGDIKDV